MTRVPAEHSETRDPGDNGTVLVALMRFQQGAPFVAMDRRNVSLWVASQGHRVKIGRLGRMANPIFGAILSFFSIFSQLFTSFFVVLVIEPKYKLYAQ